MPGQEDCIPLHSLLKDLPIDIVLEDKLVCHL
jgi:hypothetical protein